VTKRKGGTNGNTDSGIAETTKARGRALDSILRFIFCKGKSGWCVENSLHGPRMGAGPLTVTVKMNDGGIAQ
jgi:hypothetical protein